MYQVQFNWYLLVNCSFSVRYDLALSGLGAFKFQQTVMVKLAVSESWENMPWKT